uniref:protein O-linked-mannose beta-1,4-N-acetylglucosaminyltransferase 2 isoform X1 n=1 Tax=Myxine glutinosa TaxID=7769 RepID=UPI00358DEC48
MNLSTVLNGILLPALAAVLWQYGHLRRRAESAEAEARRARESPLLAPADYDAAIRELHADGTTAVCTGKVHTDRLCRFQHLCYWAPADEFLFFHGPGSVALPSLGARRFQPALLDLSTVDDHNTQYFNVIDLPVSSLDRLPRPAFLSDTALIFNRFNPENLMHVLHDDLLPAFYTLKQFGELSWNYTRLVLTEGWSEGPHFELYRLLTGRQPLLRGELSSLGDLLCYPRAYVGLNKLPTWYQYGFTQPQGPKPNLLVSGNEIRHFATFIRAQLNVSESNTYSVNGGTSEPYIVLIRRTFNRLILNEAELILAIAQEFDARLLAVSLDSHPFSEIVRIVSGAAALVSMHGSQLAVAVFLPPGAAVVEIFPYAVNPTHYTPYRTLASLPGMALSYIAWRNERIGDTVTHPDRPWDEGGIAHLPSAVQERIERSVEVPLHLCCRHPEWLYRIYQDTRVDIASFLATMRQVIPDKLTAPGQVPVTPVFPSRVRVPRCKSAVDPISAEAHIMVTWQPPWNLDFLEPQEVQYEVWIQEEGENTYSPYILSALNHTFAENIHPGTSYHVWIRCLLGPSLQGPFADALTCYT